MDILFTVVLMLLVGTLCFMLGAFAQESSGIFQFRERTEESTRDIVLRIDTENLKGAVNECFNEIVKTIEKCEKKYTTEDDEEDEDE